MLFHKSLKGLKKMNNEGQAQAISDQDHQIFMDYLATTRHAARDQAIYLMTMRAGLRISEVAGLTMDDLLNADGSIKQVVVLRRKITKGAKTRTAYFSHPELRQSLANYLKQRPGSKSMTLFVSQKGGSFSANSLAQVMLKHYNRAGLEGCSSHSGRRSCLTALLKKGVDIVAVSKVAGHASIATTQRYIHHDQEELLAAVAL